MTRLRHINTVCASTQYFISKCFYIVFQKTCRLGLGGSMCARITDTFLMEKGKVEKGEGNFVVQVKVEPVVAAAS